MNYTVKNDFFKFTFDECGYVTDFSYNDGANVAKKTPLCIITKKDKTESYPISAKCENNLIKVTFDCGVFSLRNDAFTFRYTLSDS